MSTSSDPEFDLEQHFLPAWAQQPASKNLYAHFKGEPEREDRRGSRDRPPGRRGPGRDRPPGRNRRPGGPGAPDSGPPRDREGRRRADGPRRGPGGDRSRPQRAPRVEAPLVEVDVAIVADDIGVDSLARQIRMTGRAYPLFDIARMVIQKPERHRVTLSVKKNAEGQPKQGLVACAVDQTVWLSEEEAMQHVLDRHFALFYQPEKTQIDPPKGTYTFVAQCGMSGVILGPPNHHDYQNHLRKLHGERFSKMPFESFKSRVKIVKDEAVVKKWIEDQSFKTEYVCLNLPEPLKLGSLEDVRAHFRQTHQPNIIQPVETFQLKGSDARNIRCPELARLVRVTVENQRRFPLQVATVLSQQFASRGLQFFKVNRTITHVAVARPHYLDLDVTPVSDGIKRLVQFINGHPGCNRKKLIEALAPAHRTSAPTPPPPPPPQPPNQRPAPRRPLIRPRKRPRKIQPKPRPNPHRHLPPSKPSPSRNPPPNKPPLSPISIGSSTRGTSLSSPTACSKPPRNPRPNRPSRTR